MLKELDGKGLLIHHWDTDGICSARLMLEHLNKNDIDNRTPELGNYYLTEKELEEYSKYDFIIVVDMALPEDNIITLAKNAKVMIFDHHLQQEIKSVFHYNPIIKGGNPDEYPSASWIVNEYLGNSVNLYALLGILGDHEQKIKNNKLIYNKITDFCNKNNLNFDDMLKMVYLLDSSYKLGNKEEVQKIPHILMQHGSAEDILANEIWNRNLKNLEDEIKKQLEKTTDEVAGIILKKIDTPYNIISTITRKIAWESGKNTLVINTGFFKDKDQIYLRSDKNVELLIKKGKEQCFKCGGKKEVMGAILPKEKTESFVNEIIAFLTKNQ